MRGLSKAEGSHRRGEFDVNCRTIFLRGECRQVFNDIFDARESIRELLGRVVDCGNSRERARLEIYRRLCVLSARDYRIRGGVAHDR